MRPLATTSSAAATRRVQLAAVAVFATLLIVPGLYQCAFGLRAADVARWRAFASQERTTADALRRVEADFDARFLLGTVLRNWRSDLPVGRIVPRPIGDVTPDTEYRFVDADAQVPRAAGLLTARLDRPTQAIRALADASDRLRARGVRLVVVPVPSKASIYPDKLERGYDVAARGPDLNADHAAWFARLRAADVEAIDLAGALWRERARERDDPAAATFTAADSHWTWHGVSVAADAIAASIAPHLTDAPRAAGLHRRLVRRARPNDIADPSRPAPPTQYETRAYLLDAADRTVLADDADAAIVVLGDSFAADFVAEGGGLAQAIEFATGGVRTRSAAVFGGNVYSMRAPLADPAVIGPRVRVVVLAFAMRHLITSDWPIVPIAAAAAASSR